MENYICNAGFVNNEVTISRDHCENGYNRDLQSNLYYRCIFRWCQMLYI